MPTPFNAKRRNSAWYGKGRVLRGQPRHCTNASRGLSATAEFLVSLNQVKYSTVKCFGAKVDSLVLAIKH